MCAKAILVKWGLFEAKRPKFIRAVVFQQRLSCPVSKEEIQGFIDLMDFLTNKFRGYNY